MLHNSETDRMCLTWLSALLDHLVCWFCRMVYVQREQTFHKRQTTFSYTDEFAGGTLLTWEKLQAAVEGVSPRRCRRYETNDAPLWPESRQFPPSIKNLHIRLIGDLSSIITGCDVLIWACGLNNNNGKKKWKQYWHVEENKPKVSSFGKSVIYASRMSFVSSMKNSHYGCIEMCVPWGPLNLIWLIFTLI